MSRARSQRASQNPSRPASNATAMRVTRRPFLMASARQRSSKESSSTSLGSMRPGNAGGGKDPDFWRAFNGGEETVIGDEPANTRTDPDPPAEAVSHGEGGSAPHGALARHPPLRLRSGVRQARRASAAPDACGA